MKRKFFKRRQTHKPYQTRASTALEENAPAKSSGSYDMHFSSHLGLITPVARNAHRELVWEGSQYLH